MKSLNTEKVSLKFISFGYLVCPLFQPYSTSIDLAEYAPNWSNRSSKDVALRFKKSTAEVGRSLLIGIVINCEQKDKGKRAFITSYWL